MNTNWSEIVAHYESCLEKHGDNHLGVDWPNKMDASIRYSVMADLIKDDYEEMDFSKLLDYGCGLAGYIENEFIMPYRYFGYDKSEKMISQCKKKFPGYNFSSTEYPESDYVIMNGVFTEKRSITFGQMWTMTQAELLEVWQKTKKGLAFNVMSSHVDWEKEELFHLPIDTMAEFVTKNLSRKFVVRQDYLPYEYTVYIYR